MKPPILQPWTVLESRTTYRDHWMSLRTERCQRNDGQLIEAYHILEFSDWINVIALTEDQELVLVREYRHAAAKILLGLPSGTLDANELPLHTAQRELGEETGYHAKTWYSLGNYYANPATQKNRVHSFLALDAYPGQATQWDEAEQIETVLLPLRDLPQQLGQGEFDLQGLHVSALFLAARFALANQLPQLAQALLGHAIPNPA